MITTLNIGKVYKFNTEVQPHGYVDKLAAERFWDTSSNLWTGRCNKETCRSRVSVKVIESCSDIGGKINLTRGSARTYLYYFKSTWQIHFKHVAPCGVFSIAWG